MKYPINTYKIIAVISFTILSVVQVFLVGNTYQLENDRYYFSEKKVINEKYIQWITNDKLFPGGQSAIDTMMRRNTAKLEWLYNNDKGKFNIEKQKLCDSIFNTLHQHQLLGSFLHSLKKTIGLTDSLEYALIIEDLELMLGDRRYAVLYNKKEQYPLIDAAIQQREGVRIGGNLEQVDLQSRVTWLSVSDPTPYTNKIVFALYVDNHNRTMMIVKRMMPVLLLSLVSLLINVLLFYVTFKNWLKQKQLSEMKTDFLNSITHEFNTPIAAINVANKSLRNEKITDRKQNIISLADVIQRQAARLQKLVSQVLDVTSLNQLTLHKEQYSLHALLEEILLDYRLNVSDQEIKLTLRKEANRDTVELDRFYFTTMLLNILDNAIKYNDQDVKEIVVSTSNDKKAIQLSIQDNGIGMTEETKSQVFKKFFRVAKNSEKQIMGLGLGLYYVKQCIDAHEWELFVGSSPGEGTTFIISIPY
ncbi:MAG: sensor histidine kinase [Agriterribacter sp.]